MRTVILSSNTSWSLHNFRLQLIKKLLENDYRVIIIAPTDGHSERLRALGCTFIDLKMDRHGANPWKEATTLIAYRRCFRYFAPAVSLQYTLKPVTYAAIASIGLNISNISTFTGLGRVFGSGGLLRWIAEYLCRFALHRSYRLFFQNADDLRVFEEMGVVQEDKVEIVPGSGVDLERFGFCRLPEDDVTFLFIGRLLREKGVVQFVDAARIIKGQRPSARFCILGPFDLDSPSAITKAEVDAWVVQGLVRYLGSVEDVRPSITSAHCVVLPSYYREGIPKALLEAAAMGRPIITTDSVGCRETVDDGVNGYLCRPRDVDDLAEKMRRFIDLSRSAMQAMGNASRDKAEKAFDEGGVVSRYMRAVESAFRDQSLTDERDILTK